MALAATDNRRSSDLEDPLESYSGLSLFPRTLIASLPNPPKLSDLHDAHSFLRSMPMRSPSKLVEEAKFIVDSSSELLNSTNDEVGIAASRQENKKERRPGIARKRPRFSMKPNSSQCTVNLEPMLDIAKLSDPEEFFSAFDRLENAKMEIQRQTGSVLTEIDQNRLFTVAPRPRRAGIPGRTVKQKRSYSISLPSQDTIEEDDSISHDQSSQKETTNANHESEKKELAGSINETENETENKENELLDELLTGSYEELVGDKAVDILRERLQIKPFELEKLRLPEMEDIHKMDLKTSGRKLQRPRDSLSDIFSSLKGVTINKTPSKRTNAESLDSPSPLAFPVKNTNQQSEWVETEKVSSALRDLNSSMVEENDPGVANMGSGVGASGPHTGMEDNTEDGMDHGIVNEDIDQDPGMSYQVVNEENTEVANTGSGVGASGPHTALEDNTEDGMDHEIVNEDNDQYLGMGHGVVNEENTEDACMDHEVVNEENTVDAFKDHGVNEDNADVDRSNPVATEDHTKNADNVPEHDYQKVQESSRVPPKEQRKTVSRPSKVRKSKVQSRRDSLAGSGTFLENGVRRSTRIRSRPLEYWKGERFLYGRLHQSLPTVIGIKYESPAKEDAKPTFKVKSYISDDYKELIDLAALH